MTKYCNDMALAPLSGGWPAGWDIFYGMCDQASTPAGAYYDVTWVDSASLSQNQETPLPTENLLDRGYWWVASSPVKEGTKHPHQWPVGTVVHCSRFCADVRASDDVIVF